MFTNTLLKKTLDHSFSTNRMSKKNMWSISLQKICEVNTRVLDLPRCYKSYVFSERDKTVAHPALDDTYPTTFQLSEPYSLDYRTIVSNYDSQFEWESSTHAAVRIC